MDTETKPEVVLGGDPLDGAHVEPQAAAPAQKSNGSAAMLAAVRMRAKPGFQTLRRGGTPTTSEMLAILLLQGEETAQQLAKLRQTTSVPDPEVARLKELLESARGMSDERWRELEGYRQRHEEDTSEILRLKGRLALAGLD